MGEIERVLSHLKACLCEEDRVPHRGEEGEGDPVKDYGMFQSWIRYLCFILGCSGRGRVIFSTVGTITERWDVGRCGEHNLTVRSVEGEDGHRSGEAETNHFLLVRSMTVTNRKPVTASILLEAQLYCAREEDLDLEF